MQLRYSLLVDIYFHILSPRWGLPLSCFSLSSSFFHFLKLSFHIIYFDVFLFLSFSHILLNSLPIQLNVFFFFYFKKGKPNKKQKQKQKESLIKHKTLNKQKTFKSKKKKIPNKTKQKISHTHKIGVCFVLFNNFWTWGLLWSVVNISRDLPLEKIDFPFARGYQLQITWLEMGPHVYFLLSVLRLI